MTKLRMLLFATLLQLSTLAIADNLSDLKSALTNLQGKAAIKAKVSVQLEISEGEGKEVEYKAGGAALTLENSTQGMKLSYSPDTLNQLAAEQAALESPDNVQAKTATLAAVEAINADTIRKMTNASQYLSSKLARATFKNEQTDKVQDQTARLLIFDLQSGNLSKNEQAYVKKYEGVLKVWLAADGMPLASVLDENYAGRAYLVVNFKIVQKESMSYRLLGKRLVATRYETLNKHTGGGELGATKVVRTLEMQP